MTKPHVTKEELERFEKLKKKYDLPVLNQLIDDYLEGKDYGKNIFIILYQGVSWYDIMSISKDFSYWWRLSYDFAKETL